MSWEVVSQERMDVAKRDITKLARSGARSIRRELQRETEDKRAESRRLRAATRTLRALADGAASEGPVEFSYTYTARSPSGDLVTKTEALTLADAEEALAAADKVEKRSDAWEKLRIEMLAELKLRDQRWTELSKSLSSFAEASRGLVQEVLVLVI